MPPTTSLTGKATPMVLMSLKAGQTGFFCGHPINNNVQTAGIIEGSEWVTVSI